MRTRKRVGPSKGKERIPSGPSASQQLARTRAKLKTLEADRQTLSAIVDSSRDALWTWSSNGTILRWNAEAERLFGYSADEIIGQSVLTLIPPDRHHRALEIIGKALQGQWFGQYETVRLRKDGSKVDVELTVSPIKNTRGKVIGCLSSCRDITERKLVQLSLTKRMRELVTLTQFTERLQAARHIEQVYEAALEAIRDALGCDRASMLLYDSAKIMRFVAWRELSEQYRKAVDGHSPWTPDVQNPEPIFVEDIDCADQPKSLKETLKSEGIRALSFIPLLAEGKLIGKVMTYYREPHRFSLEEERLANSIAQQLAIGIDRHKAHKELQESESRFRLMVENAPVMIWMCGADGRCQHLNSILRAFWGVSEADLAEFDWQDDTSK